MSENLPKFTFIVPVRDESARIDRCLASIRGQDYPREQIEIHVPDQGSTDDTREKARSYGALVTANPAQRGIFSMPAAFRQAGGDLICVMAADNVLRPSFARRMAEPFVDPSVRFAFAHVTDDRPDYALTTRYINRFTDPFNQFIYGAACNSREFHKAYAPLRTTPNYALYRFPAERPPLLAIAQGAVIRAPYSMPDDYEDDVGCVFDMIASGAVMACVDEPLVDHYTTTGLFDLLKKFQPRIAKNFKPASSLRWRDRYVPADRRFRRSLWPFYAVSIVPPVFVALWRALRDREPLWLFHPIIGFAFAWITAIEACKNLGDAFDLLFNRHAVPSGETSKE
jgi:glycosyltransferase involved in cell wall biosynthesis